LQKFRRLCAKHRRVVLINEYKTSKTAHCCGTEVTRRGNRVMECPRCKRKYDRDYNASINIKTCMLKWLVNGTRPTPLRIPDHLKYIAEHVWAQ
jgi:transposase